MRTKKRRDILAVGLIWAFVIAVAFALGASTDDAAGAGQTAAGVGIALTSVYLYVRRLRGRRGLIRRATLWRSPGGAEPGSVTLTWLRIVVAILLWIAGSGVALIAGVPDAWAFWLGGLLPAVVFVVPRLGRQARDLRRWPGPRRARRSRR